MINFYSIHFIIFLTISVLCYYTVFRKKQWICLLAASVYFYYQSGAENFVFLLLTGLSTWTGAYFLEYFSGKTNRIKKIRRVILWSVILFNFGMLSYIKYADEIFENFSLGLLLPLGISFYMFQSVGYLIDIYNQKYKAEKNFAKYMLFVSYFPQMIQGPINRYDILGNQMAQEHRWNGEAAVKAGYRIAYGLLKKFAVANVYAGIVADIFDNLNQGYAGATILFGILLYSFQQYADFSGGIDMVLGVSELFGIQMAENFRQPYFSVSLGEFWRRWHISLGKWMRDYVFYPFALTKPMKKFGKWANKNLSKHMGRVLPAAIGNILVFFIVGLWHGAQWHYIIWGLYNGVIIALSDIMAPVFHQVTDKLKINVHSFAYHLFQIARTFLIVNIGWYFDRITDVKMALYALQRTVCEFNVQELKREVYILIESYSDDLILMSMAACGLMLFISILKERGTDVRNVLYHLPLPIRWMIYLLTIGFIVIANGSTAGAGGFMYANF